MTLKVGNVERNLNAIRDSLWRILEDDAATVLGKATAGLAHSARMHAESVRQGRPERPIQPWGFRISPDQPLRFRETESDGFRVRVDLFARAYWNTEPAEKPAELTVAMRVWCLDENLYFRDQWDAARLENEIDGHSGRVVLRVHFDLAEHGQPGPRHHIQVGGKQHSGEFHWFPETLSVPRIVHMPFDLVLAAELVAATFYPEEYKRIRREPTWKHCTRTAQKHLLPVYLQKAIDAVADGRSVLEALWNVPWE